MSVRGWIFVAMLLSVAVLVKPALKVAWPPEPDTTISDETGTVADGADQSDFGVADDQSTFASGGAPTAPSPDRTASAADTPAMQAGRTEQPQFVASDTEKRPVPAAPVRTDAAPVNPPSTEPATPQSEMADITRSIVRDYATRRERALLSPNVAAIVVPPEDEEARQSQQRAADDARRASAVVVAEAEGKLEAEQKRTSALADQLADAKAQLAAAQTTVGHLRDAVTSADSRSDDWHRAVEQSQAETADTKDALAKATLETSDTKEALAKARTEAADATTALAQARAEAVGIAERQKDIDHSAILRIEELQQQLDAESTRAVDLTRELESVRAQIADADRQKTADADERRALEAASKGLQAKLQDEQNRNAALTTELATAQDSIRQLREQARASQAAVTPVRPGQSVRTRRPERGVPEARMDPAKPAGQLARLSPSGTADAPRSAAKLTDTKPKLEDGAGKAATGAKGQGTLASRATGRSDHGRSGEVIAYIPESPVQDEGYTSDDYSPYDSSDHTVYIDEYVTTPKARARRSEVRVAKRSVEVR